MPRGGGRSNSRSSGSRSSFFSRRNTPPRQSPPPRQSYQAPPRQAPQQAPVAAPQQAMPMRPMMGGGIGSTIVTGMALGAGSEVGHQVVRSFMGGSGHREGGHVEQQPQQQMEQYPQEQIQHYPQQQMQEVNNTNDKCFDYTKMFNECMKLNFNNTTICQQSFEELRKCQNMI